MNIAHSLQYNAGLYPDKVAILFEGRSITYQELERAAATAAAALQTLGVKQGDRVALFLPNIVEFIFSYYAIQKIGAIAVSINVMLKNEELSFIVNHSGSAIIITTETLRKQLDLDQLPNVRHVLIAEGAAVDALLLSQLLEQSAPLTTTLDLPPDTPAVIVYTSGTTGFPKGATLSHGNVLFNAESKRRYCRITPDDRLLLFVPLFHCFGQNAVMTSALHAGATLVLHRRFALPQIIESLAQSRVSMFFGVPTTYMTLLNAGVQVEDFQSVRYYFSAAAILPETIARAWEERFGMRIHEGYGLTETSPFASYNHETSYRFGSIGVPIEQVSMKIVDAGGATLAPGQRGEILIKGPNVMLGYWEAPEETAQVLRDGWFSSGDVAVQDEAGYFYIVDRIKDMINVSGFKVYPAEVERVLYTHPAVQEAIIYGVPDPLKGECVRALIVLKQGQQLTEAELASYCQERIATYKVPRSMEFTSAIPRSPSGKVQKWVLRQQAEQIEA